MVYRGAVLILSLWMFIPAAAAEIYDLRGLIDRAIARSDRVVGRAARVEGKKFLADQARVAQNPQIEFSRGTKEEGSQDGPLYEVSLEQPLYVPGKRVLRGEIADLSAGVAESELAEERLFVTSEVVRAAFEYALLSHKLEVADRRMARFETVRAYLAGHVFASPQRKAESRIVENHLKNITAEVLALRADRRAALARLNLYAALDGETEPAVRVPWFGGARALDRAVWMKKAEAQNLSIAARRLEIEIARREKKLAEKEALPDFSVSAFQGRERAAGTEKQRGVGVSWSFPIFNRNVGNIQSAEKRREAEEALLRHERRALESEVDRILTEYEAARQAVRLYPQESFASLERQMEETDDEFRKGRVDLLTFLELDSRTTETLFRALDAQESLAESLAALGFLASDATLTADIERF